MLDRIIDSFGRSNSDVRARRIAAGGNLETPILASRSATRH